MNSDYRYCYLHKKSQRYSQKSYLRQRLHYRHYRKGYLLKIERYLVEQLHIILQTTFQQLVKLILLEVNDIVAAFHALLPVALPQIEVGQQSIHGRTGDASRIVTLSITVNPVRTRFAEIQGCVIFHRLAPHQMNRQEYDTPSYHRYWARV